MEEGGDASTVQSQFENAARIEGNESVVTWGKQISGGNSSYVQHQLQNVEAIYSTYTAFTALLPNGFVVAWGNASSGGDSFGNQHQLQNVQRLYSIRSYPAQQLHRDLGRAQVWQQ